MAFQSYQTINVSAVKLLPADTTAFKDVWTAGASGGMLNCLKLHSTDTASRDVQIAIQISGVDFPIGTVACLGNLGNTNAIQSQNLLGMPNIHTSFTHDHNGNHAMMFPPNAKLRARVLVAITATREISLIAEGMNL